MNDRPKLQRLAEILKQSNIDRDELISATTSLYSEIHPLRSQGEKGNTI